MTGREIAALLKPPSVHCAASNVVRTGGVVPAAPSRLPEWTGQAGVVPLGLMTGPDGRERLGAVPQEDVLFGAGLGRSGFGKSELALLQALTLAYAGFGLWFLDSHGAAVQRALPYLTHPALTGRVLLIDVSVKDPLARMGAWNPLSMEGRAVHQHLRPARGRVRYWHRHCVPLHTRGRRSAGRASELGWVMSEPFA